MARVYELVVPVHCYTVDGAADPSDEPVVSTQPRKPGCEEGVA